MQNSQMQTIAESQTKIPVLGVEVKQQITNEFRDISMVETASQLQPFMSPSNSATSPFDTLPMATVDSVSSVVSMLKGSLEKKRFGRQVVSENCEGTPYVFSNVQPEGNLSFNQEATNQICWPTNTFQFASSIQEPNSINLQVEKSLEPNMDAYVTQANQFQISTLSQEPSQSGSSTAVPTFSTGFDPCDDIANSAQTIACEISKKHLGNGNVNHKARGLSQF